MAATDYVTLDGTGSLKEHLGPIGTEFDVKLTNVIASVSRWIDGYCHRHFYQDGVAPGSPVTRVFDARTCRQVRLGDTPALVNGVTILSDLLAVTEVATDDNADGTFETVWSSSDYQLLPLNTLPARELRAIGTRQFPVPRWDQRAGLVRIKGVWGWSVVPDDVREACLIQCARIFKRKDSPEGVANFDQFGVIRVSGRPDPDVATNLTHLVHPQAVLVA